MADLVLALNAGSSTVKFALFTLEAEPRLRLRGLIDGVGKSPALRVTDAAGAVLDERAWSEDPGRAPEGFADDILNWVEARLRADRLDAVSHRICHGGELAGPVELTPAMLRHLDALAPLAPLHQPHNLAMARAVARRRPRLASIGGFDTAFFHALPAPAQAIPLPAEWRRRGVRRYGFHGLSYAYLGRRLAALKPLGTPRRVVFAHLGSGASLCACDDGRPVETTMGFSPLDGLVMSTRCGALDPGVPLFLQAHGVDPEALEDLLYRRSGLLAASGLSGDMRVLLASDSPAAKAAVELFVHRLVREIGALAGCLGGLDAVVFSAGIGENAPAIRRMACERLAWLGLELDEEANAEGATRISRAGSAVSAWVIPTDEEATLAAAAAEVLASRSAPAPAAIHEKVS